MEGTIGEIKMFAGNFAPRTWAFCQGQIMPIAQNTALFSILGTTYGGDGQTTFALPNLAGRVPVGAGQGPGLSYIDLGEVSGSENVRITINELPGHTHIATSNVTLKASGSPANTAIPVAGTALAAAKDINTDAVSIYSTGTPDVNLNPASGAVTTTVQPIGNNLPFSIRNPYLGMNYIICLNGIFPSRN
ncbi:MAG: tail fiber protein [Pedobacter sp.]|uniref:phage tail protein n=1 Tax=Pedobacter sp. TaxID=1411316 RepID=UPI003567C867